MALTFHLRLVAPGRTMFDGDVESAVIPAADGLMGILPGHAPFLGLLGPGRVIVRHGAAETTFAVAGGTTQVLPDGVIILAEEPNATP
jgi:F-type H+-transporting ATPase subunit epsilon